MYIGEDIKQQREARANNIVKGFSNSDYLLEKAHNHGDVHSNGKWYWESSANGGKGDWRTIKGAGKATPAATAAKPQPKAEEKKEDDKKTAITAKQAFADVQSLNPSTSTVSSIGTFVSSQNQQIADAKAKEIMGYLPKDSLAYKIVSSSSKFSDKQLWVIAYELVKNKDYQKDLAESIEESERQAAYQKARKSAKRKAKSEQKKQAKATADEAMKKYDDIDSDDKVEHPTFGEGKVMSQTDDKITVFFKKVGEKVLLKKYTPLKKL